jgi:integrase
LKSVSQNFVGFYCDYIDGVKFIYKKGKPYPVSERTRQKYKTTLRHLKAFIALKQKTYDFEDIDLEFYHDFVDFLRNNAKKVATKKVPNPEPIKMTENTVGKHITTIKTILNAATDAGVNNNLKYQSQKFAVLTEDVDKIYLTESELKKIYDQDFSKTKSLDRVRDLFLVGCYTCLRFSDFTNINPANIYNNEKGTFIKLSTVKTGELVVIPLHWIVTSILHKYDYNLPKSISNQKMNDYLKEIGSKAGIDDPVSITKFEGGIKIARTYPKYKLISTHTARRSGATNMYLAGIPAISIMKITGHRTEQAFMRYIQMTQEDNANKLMDHPFFANQQNLKVI